MHQLAGHIVQVQHCPSPTTTFPLGRPCGCSAPILPRPHQSCNYWLHFGKWTGQWLRCGMAFCPRIPSQAHQERHCPAPAKHMTQDISGQTWFNCSRYDQKDTAGPAWPNPSPIRRARRASAGMPQRRPSTPNRASPVPLRCITPSEPLQGGLTVAACAVPPPPAEARRSRLPHLDVRWLVAVRHELVTEVPQVVVAKLVTGKVLGVAPAPAVPCQVAA